MTKSNDDIIATAAAAFLGEMAAQVATAQVAAVIENQDVSAAFAARQGVAVLGAAVIVTVKNNPGINTTQVGDILNLDLVDEHNNFVRSILVMLEEQKHLRSEKEGTERKWYVSNSG